MTRFSPKFAGTVSLLILSLLCVRTTQNRPASELARSVAPSYGAHMLRHSAATEMLRKGASLYEISAILRHRSIATTAVYAKVDIASLKLVAQPWPEVQ